MAGSARAACRGHRVIPRRRGLFGAFWTSGQEHVLSVEERTLLHQLRPFTPAAAQDCILFSDPNKDPDDVVSFVMAKQLEMLGLARIGHVVTTLGPHDVRAERAMLTKGVFGALGMPGVGVAIGRDYEIGARQADHGSFLSRGKPLCAAHAGVSLDSLACMRQSLLDASDKVTLIAIVGMTDANALLVAEPDLVRQKSRAGRGDGRHRARQGRSGPGVPGRSHLQQPYRSGGRARLLSPRSAV